MNHSIDYYINQLIYHTDLFDSRIHNFNPNQTFDFSNETILITGAAGTIGQELFKQLLNCTYKKIILIDIAESGLHELLITFRSQLTDAVVFKIININDKLAVEHIFQLHQPTVVFHCAAYKHVPMMETNAYEAVKTNILATKTLVDVSTENHVSKFVFISSDKAVDPINIMGITKHIAEQYLEAKSKLSPTEFIITRFGNILGSNGSVLPVFLKQITLNLPLTITDKSMTRFFITKEKACQLILESILFNANNFSALSFLNNRPVKISELAKHVISISEKENVKIEISGIRSGEKLHEIMVSKTESSIATNHPDIFRIINKKKSATRAADFKSLENISPFSSIQDIESILRAFL